MQGCPAIDQAHDDWWFLPSDRKAGSSDLVPCLKQARAKYGCAVASHFAVVAEGSLVQLGEQIISFEIAHEEDPAGARRQLAEHAKGVRFLRALAGGVRA